MSDLGVRPAEQQTLPTAHKPSSDIPLWVLLVAIVLMLVLAAAAAVVLMGGGKAKPARSYPAQWDSRVAPYAKIVEQKRGLFFQHPVTVRFLPAAEFEKGVTSDEKDLDKEERKEIDQVTGMMRALGLITGDVDLFASLNDLSGGGTLAYYSYEDERITIRGEQVTPAVRSTLVHELTHVLQDQYFKFGDQIKRLEKAKDSKSTSESSVLHSVIEGDAERVETLYRDSLNARQRKALDTGRKDDLAQADKRRKQIPEVLITMMTSPYTLGQGLVQTVAADGGNPAVDALFRKVPKHESTLLDPFEALADNSDAVKVAPPKLEDGEKEDDSGEFGVLTWYFMLAERVPLLDALAAADGWGGDAYVAFERDGASCARMEYAGRTPADTTRMFSALQRWVSAAPGSPAKVSRDGDLLHFESCDPGKDADVGKEASQDAVNLLTIRNSIGVALLKQGATPKVSRCSAVRMVRTFPVSVLVAREVSDPAVRARIQDVFAGCR
ncbi:MAG: hypothetical protein JWR85_2077 [Marmoricola sp.]|nr:hypothetical protein [Marmoricola sp.]